MHMALEVSARADEAAQYFAQTMSAMELVTRLDAAGQAALGPEATTGAGMPTPLEEMPLVFLDEESGDAAA